MHTNGQHSISRRMTALKSLPLMALLSFMLLFAQAVEHGHSHDADLQSQFDCEICLKVGSLDDLAVADVPRLDVSTGSHVFAALVTNPLSSKPARAAARAPPASHA